MNAIQVLSIFLDLVLLSWVGGSLPWAGGSMQVFVDVVFLS